MSEPSVRCFWAVRPPEPNLEEAGRLARALKRPLADLGLKVAWVAPTSYHLTLKFLGEVAEGRLGEMVARVGAELAAAAPAPPLTLAGLGVFPGLHRPQVVFLGATAGAAALGRLQLQVEGCLTSLGYAPEARPFHPHLTLGRVRAGRELEADSQAALHEVLQRHREPQGPPFPLTELVLYESRATPQGPSYVPLVRLPLPPGAETFAR